MSGAVTPASTAGPGRKAEATRQALLDAARTVIARDGFANARIVDIARQAGKSVGVFYAYFQDKPALFAALLEAFHQDVVRLTPAPAAYEEDTTEAVRAALRGFWTTYRRYHPEMLGLLETGLADAAVLEVWRRMRHRGIRRFAFRIRRQQARGRCLGLDAELAASALHGMLEFTCFNWHSRKLDWPDAAIDDECAVDTLYRIVARVLELDDEDTLPAKAPTPATAISATATSATATSPARAAKRAATPARGPRPAALRRSAAPRR
jgi:AcrR family transcriptional regulator